MLLNYCKASADTGEWHSFLFLRYMKLSILILLFLLTGNGFLLGQRPELEITYMNSVPDAARYIAYDLHRPLTIADFQGKPDELTDVVAITSSGFQYRAGYRRSGSKSILKVSVYCSFDRKESWMKEKGRDPQVLAHEQAHFDISYLQTLLFMQRLRQLRLGEQGFMEQLREEYDAAVKELRARQRQYDQETDHGTLPDIQLVWSKRIRNDISAVFHREKALTDD